MKKIFILGLIGALLFIPCGVLAIEFSVTPNSIDFGILDIGGGAGSNKAGQLTIKYNDTPGTIFSIYVQGQPDLTYQGFDGGGVAGWKRFLWNKTDGTMMSLTKPLAINTELRDPRPPPELAMWYLYLDEDGRGQIVNNKTTGDDGWYNYKNWGLIQPAKMTDHPGIYRTTLVLTVEEVINPPTPPEILARVYSEEDIYNAPF